MWTFLCCKTPRASVGDVFDAAAGQGLLNFILRGRAIAPCNL